MCEIFALVSVEIRPASPDMVPPKGCCRRRAVSTRAQRLCSSLFLEHEPVVLQQLPLEADLVGAHPGREREPEVGAGEPAREELKLEQRLSETGGADPSVPLTDGFDV